MSYLVLARKWRPKTFQDLTGQTHVVGALTGAFERGHLHHAYLLTGTRGVGKTTIARILAKSFNCETGVTATPCGICSACSQIDNGRFPDMLEIDAASHTGIDNVREILDNAHYLPTMGRHKVYLIDEVHMLSKAAFNAMLKTLEEPPLHVKFILATTDPHKIPPTVLSRCLQFHLRPLQRPQIEARFAYILGQENIEYEAPALTLIANAAQGSLRDGLSLLDQAIAYGSGRIQEAVVRDMLGIVDQGVVFDLLDALERLDAKGLEVLIHQLAQETHAFESVLEELAQQLHYIALVQQVPESLQYYPQEAVRLQALAERLAPETVQLFYQIALHGKRDLALAPDALAGLTMTLLRMLSFRPILPGSTIDIPTTVSTSSKNPSPASNIIPLASAAPPQPESITKASTLNTIIPPLPVTPPLPVNVASANTTISPSKEEIPSPIIQAPSPPQNHHTPDSNEAWQHLIHKIKVSPMVRQLLLQSAWSSYDQNTLTLSLTPQHKHLLTFQKELASALQMACNSVLTVIVQIHNETDDAPATMLDTPAQRLKTAEREEHAARIQAFSNDPFVQTLCDATGAQIDEGTVRPLSSPSPTQNP